MYIMHARVCVCEAVHACMCVHVYKCTMSGIYVHTYSYLRTSSLNASISCLSFLFGFASNCF